MSDLNGLKESIEIMSKHHQIEVLRILFNRQDIHINENQNGTFVNLSTLSKEVLESLFEYSEYVKDQQKTIAIIESKKKFIQNKYFKDNKECNVLYTHTE